MYWMLVFACPPPPRTWMISRALDLRESASSLQMPNDDEICRPRHSLRARRPLRACRTCRALRPCWTLGSGRFLCPLWAGHSWRPLGSGLVPAQRCLILLAGVSGVDHADRAVVAYAGVDRARRRREEVGPAVESEVLPALATDAVPGLMLAEATFLAHVCPVASRPLGCHERHGCQERTRAVAGPLSRELPFGLR